MKNILIFEINIQRINRMETLGTASCWAKFCEVVVYFDRIMNFWKFCRLATSLELGALKVALKIKYNENINDNLKFFLTFTCDLNLSKCNGVVL